MGCAIDLDVNSVISSREPDLEGSIQHLQALCPMLDRRIRPSGQSGRAELHDLFSLPVKQRCSSGDFPSRRRGTCDEVGLVE
jgi:hypothetical protein